jgi:hypothetical protein
MAPDDGGVRKASLSSDDGYGTKDRRSRVVNPMAGHRPDENTPSLYSEMLDIHRFKRLMIMKPFGICAKVVSSLM